MHTPPCERRDRRRGLLLALALHALVVGAFVFPFFAASSTDIPAYEHLVAVEFTSASAAANSPKRLRNPAPLPRPSAAPAPASAATVPTPAPAEPTTSSPTPEPLVLPESPTRESTNPAPAAPEETGRTAGSDAETGSPTPGADADVADAGKGRSTMGSALDGDGVLARAVVYRPSLDEVVVENGTVAVKLCINRDGRVIGVKWHEEGSTIRDLDVVREAMAKARDYRFERDATAPSRECGTLSIHVSGL